MSGWQPIETAPPEMLVLGWSPLWPDPEIIYRATDSSLWQEGGECGDYVDMGYEPTHWMPLPQPPDIKTSA